MKYYKTQFSNKKKLVIRENNLFYIYFVTIIFFQFYKIDLKPKKFK